MKLLPFKRKTLWQKIKDFFKQEKELANKYLKNALDSNKEEK